MSLPEPPVNPRLTLRQALRDYAVVLLAPLLLLGPLLARGQALFWGTPALQFVPWWVYAWNCLRQGVLPLWNPLNGLGAPLLANYQLAFFYPPNWLLLPLAALFGASGVAWGYTFLAALHLAWGGLGMVLLLRWLRFAWLPQVVGGLAFGLSGYVVARLGFFSMVWVAAWLPWVIYFVDQIAGFGEWEQTPSADEETLKVSSANPRQFGQQRQGQPSPGMARKPLGSFFTIGRSFLSSVKFPLALTLCLAAQLLAGHAQLTWYTLLLAGAWVTVGALRCRPSFRRLLAAWASFAAAGALAAGLAAVQLIPTFEYLSLSQRSSAFAYQEAMIYSFWPWRFLTLFAPDFFGNPSYGNFWGYASYWEDHLYAGMLPLLLGLVTLWLLLKGLLSLAPVRRFKALRPRRWGLIAFCWALVGAAVLLALGKNTPLFPFLYRHVPTFAMFQAPARYLIWVAFALPILAAVGMEHWRSPIGKGLYWFRLGTAGAFAVTLGAGLAWMLMKNIQLTFIRATALAGMWGLGVGLLTLAIPFVQKFDRPKAWQAAVVLWTLADLLFTGWSVNPGAGLDFYAGSAAPAAASAAQTAAAAPAAAEQSAEQPPDVGQQPVSAVQASAQAAPRVYLSRRAEYDLKFRRFLRFQDFTALEDWRGLRAALIPNLNLLEGVASANNFDPLLPEEYTRWVSALETLDPPTQKAWLALAGVGLVENIDVSQPGGVRFDPVANPQRWRWYACARSAASLEDAWRQVNAEMAAPPKPGRAVILEGTGETEVRGNLPVPFGSKDGPRTFCQGQAAEAAVRLVSERPDQVTLQADTPAQGWLVLADTWYPGWQASVDGQAVPLYRADGLFRGIPLAVGKHEIIFNYRPAGFYFGGLFSILILLCTFGIRKWWGR